MQKAELVRPSEERKKMCGEISWNKERNRCEIRKWGEKNVRLSYWDEKKGD